MEQLDKTCLVMDVDWFAQWLGSAEGSFAFKPAGSKTLDSTGKWEMKCCDSATNGTGYVGLFVQPRELVSDVESQFERNALNPLMG
ncbi:MAG: hypothetical protein ACKEQI_00475 [Candidatus Hodgkinia cicadicola]